MARRAVSEQEVEGAGYLALIDDVPLRFGVILPDCPGCAATGETMDEALESAVGALRGDGRPSGKVEIGCNRSDCIDPLEGR